MELLENFSQDFQEFCYTVGMSTEKRGLLSCVRAFIFFDWRLTVQRSLCCLHEFLQEAELAKIMLLFHLLSRLNMLTYAFIYSACLAVRLGLYLSLFWVFNPSPDSLPKPAPPILIRFFLYFIQVFCWWIWFVCLLLGWKWPMYTPICLLSPSSCN